MGVLTKNEFLIAKYFAELQINKRASDETCNELIELLRLGTDVSNGFLFNSLTMMLLGEYLTNDEIFFQEYEKLRLETFFLSKEHMIDMKQHLIALSHLHIGALREEIVPNLIKFVNTVEQYDDIKDTTLKGIYLSVLSYLYRRGGLNCNIEFTASLIKKIDEMDNILNSDFTILDMILGGKPYNYD